MAALTEAQKEELERIRSWACCLEPERRFMAEIGLEESIKQGDYWCDLYKHKRAENIAMHILKNKEIKKLRDLLKRIRKHSTDRHYWGQEIDAILEGK